jgi:lantibiotic modifying enzyme
MTAPERSAGHQVTPPDWTALTELAVTACAALGEPPTAGATFADPFRSFAALAYARGAGPALADLPGLVADEAATRGTFVSALSRQLAISSEQTLAAEFAKAQPDGNPTDRDQQLLRTEFIRQHCTPQGLAGLLSAYPVLARLLGTATARAADATQELLRRFAVDREAITATLLGATDPGPVTAIEPGLGSPHQGGRTVTSLSFADGRRVIYRPRSVTAEHWFGGVLSWLNQHLPQAGLRHAAVLPRSGYGWVEFIDHQPPVDVDRFYRRYGMLLAVLYALDALGVEPGNLVASSDCPVPVKLETLFHPSPAAPAGSQDPAVAMLAASVHRTGLLQAMSAPAPRVRLGPADLADPRPADAERAVLTGFRQGYDAIAADRAEFTRLASSARDLDVRLLARPTREYRRLLAGSLTPDLLDDAGEREAALGVPEMPPASYPGWRRLVPHELADLRAGDIPLLTSRPAARGVRTSAGVQLSEVLDQPGLNQVLGKISGLGEVDRRDQEWIVSATLAALQFAGGQQTAAPPAASLNSIAAEPARLLAVACGLADQIVSRGMASGSPPRPGRVNWLSLQPLADGQWDVLPMGADLGCGYLGVALYLAQLADLTGIGRYAEVAREALNATPSLLTKLTGDHELLTATGCGGYDGLSGISYGLARMATLLRDSRLGEWATAAVRLAAVPASQTARPGWADGTAGCLAAMLAVSNEIGSPDAASLSRTTARQLAELVERTDGWCVPDGLPRQGGFAHGPAGIGWALARFAARTGEQAYLLAGRQAVRRAVDLAQATPDQGAGWCRGTAGLLAACCCLTDEASLARLRVGLRALDKRPVRRDLSLCHGELGITEAILVVSQTPGVGTSPQSLRQRSGLLLDAVHRYDRYCGTPSGVATPGLLHGLAGIGYGLLRLGFPTRVPPVLLLEPSPSAPTETSQQEREKNQE